MENEHATVSAEEVKRTPFYLQFIKVLYSPYKVFREVAEEPRYIAAMIVLVLFVVSSTLFGYIVLSKSYVEETFPKVDPLAGQYDAWTENITFWSSSPNVNISLDYSDHVNGSYYGDRSIKFCANSSQSLFLKLSDVGPVNCSEQAFKSLSFKIKFVNPTTLPSAASIYLYSGDASKYLYYNLTEKILSSSTGFWNNFTIPLSDSLWENHGGDRHTITGLAFVFNWPEKVDIKVLVDGIYFRGLFENQVSKDPTGYISIISVFGVFQYLIQLFIIAGIVFVLLNAFGGKISWKPLAVCVGLILITFFVQNIINSVLASQALDKLYYTLEYLGGSASEKAAATAELNERALFFSMIANYVQIAVLAWATLLCTMANRVLTGISWTKSAVSSVIALLVAYMIRLFIGL
ncbi:MAG: YIP1 family protein [Nitrososphaeria archaeon]